MCTSERLSVAEVDPAGYRTLLEVERHVSTCGVERSTLELVKIRISQMNGCAFCLDMHCRRARGDGERQARLDVLPGWREVAGVFTRRERAALELAESVTRIGEHGVTSAVWEQVTGQFTGTETAGLLIAIGMINVWNRLAITTRQQP